MPATTSPPATITAADIARHVRVLADDSMRGRDTPSRELDLAAHYVAARFQQFGLEPAGRIEGRDTGRVWIERYPVPGHLRVDVKGSNVMVSLRDNDTSGAQEHVSVSLEDAYLAVSQIAAYPFFTDGECRGTVLVTGHQTPASLRRLPLRFRTALYIPPAGLDSAARQAVIDQLYAQSLGVAVLAPPDSAAFDRARDAARRHSPRVVEIQLQYRLRPHGWVVHLRPQPVARLLASVGVDVERLRADSTSVERLVPHLYIAFNLRTQDLAPDVPTAPIVAGRLPGTDSTLREESIEIVAHLDGSGPRDGGGGHGGNGADDNASGVAGLLELAEAFSRPGARPARSVVFIVASGGAKPEFWGASQFSWSASWRTSVGVINLDMIGGGPKDSVIIAGMGEADGIPAVPWLASAHPELGLGIVDGGTAFDPVSEHYAFAAWRGIPAFYIHTGPHGGNTLAADTAGAVDADKAARVTRLAYYIGEALANALHRPRLNKDGRQHLVMSLDPRNND